MKFQLALATKYMRGRKLRTFLTTFAIVIGVMVIFGTGTLLPTFTDAFEQESPLGVGPSRCDDHAQDRPAVCGDDDEQGHDVEGIAAIGGSLERTMNLPPNFYGKNSTVSALSLVGVDPTVAPVLHDYQITQGRFLKKGDGNVAVISEKLADSLGLGLDDTTEAADPRRGRQAGDRRPDAGRALVGNEPVLIPLDRAQRLLDVAGRINTIEANLTNRDEAASDAIVNAIKAQLGDNYAFGGLSSGSEFAAAMQIGEMVFYMFGVLTLVMGGFIIFNTFRTIVAERRHDIGMLRAIGANRKTIIGFVLTEGLVQGVLGTAIGIGLGFCWESAWRAISPFMQQLMNTELATPAVEPALLVVSLVLGVGVTLFSGLLPALQASRVTPMEALRPPLGEVVQRVSRVGTVVGGVMLAPPSWDCSPAVSRSSRWAVCSSSSGWCWWRPRWSSRLRRYSAPCWR